MDLMDIPFAARSIAIALSAATFALGPADQTPRGPVQRNELATKYLKVLVTPIDRLAAPGATITLSLTITPGPKIHVYAPEQKDYIPVSLELQPSTDFKASPAKYPPSQPLFLAPINETARVYDKPFQIEQEITLARSATFVRRAAAKDTLVVTGTLGYQACDDRVCYRPDSLEVTWKIGLIPNER
jgi:Thiol:disulfide interchange protein DsbD, N-terminal